MFHLINHLNCSTLHQSIADDDHTQIEIIILSIFLVYIVLSNLFVVIVTIGSAQLRGCLFSMQMAAAYLGNLMAGMRFFTATIEYRGCHKIFIELASANFPNLESEDLKTIVIHTSCRPCTCWTHKCGYVWCLHSRCLWKLWFLPLHSYPWAGS